MKKTKVSGYINPELPYMAKAKFDNLLPNIVIPKTLAECKNAADRVLYYCVMLFQTSGKPYEKPDPYDQTIRVVRSGHIKPFSQFDDVMPSGEGACDAFERDLAVFENELDSDYIEQWE